MKGARGLEVTATNPDAAAAADDFVARLLRLDAGAEAILDAAETYPSTPIVQLHAATFWLYGQTLEAMANAAPHLAACGRLDMNERERALHAALTLWHANDYLRAVEALEAITADWPGDLCTAKISEFLYYVLGQQHSGPRFRAHMQRIGPAHRDDPDFLGMSAFASELCDDFAETERQAGRSLALEARNPWAQHALSHALIRQGRVAEGRAHLERFLPLLETCGRPIQSHDAWHLALLHLEELDVPGAIEVFRTHIWTGSPDVIVEQLDAISLLWRIEMAGTAMDDAWPAVAYCIVPRATETFMPFLNAHYVYALARGGRKDVLAAAPDVVRKRSEADDAEARRVRAPVGRGVVEAAAAFGSGDLTGAAALLDPVMTAVPAIGGSDAQVDLFRQAYIRGLQAADRKSDAAAYLDRMLGEKVPSSLDQALAG